MGKCWLLREEHRFMAACGRGNIQHPQRQISPKFCSVRTAVAGAKLVCTIQMTSLSAQEKEAKDWVILPVQVLS